MLHQKSLDALSAIGNSKSVLDSQNSALHTTLCFSKELGLYYELLLLINVKSWDSMCEALHNALGYMSVAHEYW